MNNLCLEFGDKTILNKVSFSLEENDKLGIIGVNGSGKTTLFKLICGEYEPTDGEVYISKGKTVGILTQYGAFDDNEYTGESALEQMYNAFPELLDMESRLASLEGKLEDINDKNHDSYVKEYTALHEKFISDGGLEFRGRCSSILSKLGFDEEHKKTDVNLLSGGQRTRLALAIQLSREPDILMLDEPTNHLDIDSREALEEALLEFDGTVITVSHDRYFLGKLATRIIELLPEGVNDINVSKSGDGYEELLRERAKRESAGAVSVSEEQKVGTQKEQYLKSKQEAAEARKAKNRLERLAKEAEGLEKELEKIEAEMNGEAAYDYVRLSELDERKNAIEERLLEIYEEI